MTEKQPRQVEVIAKGKHWGLSSLVNVRDLTDQIYNLVSLDLLAGNFNARNEVAPEIKICFRGQLLGKKGLMALRAINALGVFAGKIDYTYHL